MFQGLYATDIHQAAGAVYAVMFVAQGVLLVRAAGRRALHFEPKAATPSQAVGWLAVAYALVAYPIIGLVLGHGWPESPLFGMAPCPTTIVTLGLFLIARPPVPRHLLAVPLVWALLAPPAAIERGVWEDLALLAVGVVAFVAIVLHRRGGEEPPPIIDLTGDDSPAEVWKR